MTVSVILRLVSGSTSPGGLAGELELVGSGERAIFRTQEELVEILQRHTAPETELDREETP